MFNKLTVSLLSVYSRLVTVVTSSTPYFEAVLETAWKTTLLLWLCWQRASLLTTWVILFTLESLGCRLKGEAISGNTTETKKHNRKTPNWFTFASARHGYSTSDGHTTLEGSTCSPSIRKTTERSQSIACFFFSPSLNGETPNALALFSCHFLDEMMSFLSFFFFFTSYATAESLLYRGSGTAKGEKMSTREPTARF